MTETEEWRPIPGYEGAYEVSSHGRVRSLDREVSYRVDAIRRVKGRVRAVQINPRTGYPMVGLSLAGVDTTKHVHELVALAFRGPRPAGQYVLHENGDRTDNRATNLRYGSPTENQYDAVRHGTQWPATLTHCSARGHEFTEANTRWQQGKNGKLSRRCGECYKINARAASRRWRNRRAAANVADEGSGNSR